MSRERSRSRGDPYRILLVEDDLDQAHLIRILLEEGIDCEVTLAQDGVRGAQLAGDFDWDLVLADINLPGLDGIRVMEASKTRHPETPILATTGYSDTRYRERALRMGADDLLPKPLDRDDLLDRVRRLVAVEEDEEAPAGPTRNVLAVSTRPGDAEAGCGGILLRHLDRQDRVVLLTMLAGSDDPDRENRKQEAKRAGRALGTRLFVGRPRNSGPSEVHGVAAFVEGVLREFTPDVVYLHTPHDRDAAHRDGYRATLSVTGDVPNVYCFETGTSSVRFRPSVFIDVTEQLPRKLEALSEYRRGQEVEPHLQPAFVQACARYWGRFTGWGHAEPLEVVRGSREGVAGREEDASTQVGRAV